MELVTSFEISSSTWKFNSLRYNWYRHSDGSGTWNKYPTYCIVLFSAFSPLFHFLVILCRVRQVWSDRLGLSESREYRVFLARRELLELLAAL